MRSPGRVRIRAVLLFLALSVRVSAAADGRLIDAIKSGDIRAADQVIAAGAVDVNAAEADGTTALHWALRRDDAALTERLIRAGANVNASNRYGVSPLSLACINGNVEVVELLLNRGANLLPLAGG